MITSNSRFLSPHDRIIESPRVIYQGNYSIENIYEAILDILGDCTLSSKDKGRKQDIEAAWVSAKHNRRLDLLCNLMDILCDYVHISLTIQDRSKDPTKADLRIVKRPTTNEFWHWWEHGCY